jgi:hypothetical protein
VESSTTPSPSKTVRRVAKMLRSMHAMTEAGCSPSQMGQAMGHAACVVALLTPDEWRAAVALSEGGDQ